MPTSRVAQGVRLLVETAATVNAQEIRMQPVQGISGAGRYVIDGTTVSAVGTARLAVGQIVPVVYESGQPLVILALEWQRGRGEVGQEPALGLLEDLYVEPFLVNGQQAIWIRNHAGWWNVASVPATFFGDTSAGWGDDDDTFFVSVTTGRVTGFPSVRGDRFFVYRLTRPRGSATAGALSATLIRTVDLPSVALYDGKTFGATGGILPLRVYLGAGPDYRILWTARADYDVDTVTPVAAGFVVSDTGAIEWTTGRLAGSRTYTNYGVLHPSVLDREENPTVTDVVILEWRAGAHAVAYLQTHVVQTWTWGWTYNSPSDPLTKVYKHTLATAYETSVDKVQVDRRTAGSGAFSALYAHNVPSSFSVTAGEMGRSMTPLPFVPGPGGDPFSDAFGNPVGFGTAVLTAPPSSEFDPWPNLDVPALRAPGCRVIDLIQYAATAHNVDLGVPNLSKQSSDHQRGRVILPRAGSTGAQERYIVAPASVFPVPPAPTPAPGLMPGPLWGEVGWTAETGDPLALPVDQVASLVARRLDISRAATAAAVGRSLAILAPQPASLAAIQFGVPQRHVIADEALQNIA